DVHHGEPAHVDAVDRPRVELVRDERVARAAVGVFAYPARTEHPARARLEQRSLECVALAGRPGLLLRDRHAASLLSPDRGGPNGGHRAEPGCSGVAIGLQYRLRTSRSSFGPCGREVERCGRDIRTRTATSSATA